MNRPSAEEYYKQLSEDHRFYGELRFKQLTVWSGGIALLTNAYLSPSSSSALSANGSHPFILPIAALLVTAVFWIMEVKSTIKGVEARETQKKYERLHAHKRPDKSHWTFVNQTNATTVLYGSVYLAWSIHVFDQRQGTSWIKHASLWLPFVFGCVLALFAIIEYWDLWIHAGKRWKYRPDLRSTE